MPKLDLILFQDLPVSDLIATVSLADTNGFGNLWLIDSTDVYPDIWATAAVCAVNTSRIRIGPGVTNPLTRHPRVTANAILTIHEMSGGRGILGVGSGDNAVKTLGWKRATAGQMSEAVDTWRHKFTEKKADIPIYAATGGPMMNTFAFKEADGIIGGGGNRPEKLRSWSERMRAGLDQAGRDVTKVPLVANLTFAISDDRKEALDEARGPLPRGIKGMVKDLPQNWPQGLDEMREDARRVADAYDYMDHMKSNVTHSRLVTDAMVEEFSIADTPEEVLPKIKALWDEAASLEEAGFDFTFGAIPAGPGRRRNLELFVREILPQLG